MTTYTPDKYYEIINEFVLKLNYDWFLKKETKFRKEFYYKVDKGRIYHIDFQRIPNYDYDSETGEEILLGYEEIQNIIDIDLRSYCSCYLPIDEITDWGTWKYYDDDNRSASSNNIDENANGLVNEIAQFTAGLNDVVAISDFVSKTIYSIDEKINRLKEASHGNDIYAIVLADFLNACSRKLFHNYGRPITVHTLTRDFCDKLDFDITQEEMVSLLYILADSGILKASTKYEYQQFIPFCFKYFIVQKTGESVRLTNEKTFTEAYRRILRDENGDGLFKIKKKLEPILARITQKSKKK